MKQQLEKKIFIGSSSEGREIADIVSHALTRSNNVVKTYKLEPCLWDYADWKYNFSILNSLTEFPKKYDYSIFIFVPDDTVTSRNEISMRVRDNVLFEFGLFVSQKDGMSRSFIIHPKNKDFVLASDINGIYAPGYEHSLDKEILKNHINIAVKGIVESIDDYEKYKIKRSEQAVKNSILKLKESFLFATSEFEKTKLIIDALTELAEFKGQALNQNSSDVLYDILSWANSLIDVVDPNELAKLQSSGLEKVWIYSSNPIEFNSNLNGGLKEKFKETVLQNLAKGIHYTYFTDSTEVIKEVSELGKVYQGLIDVCILESYCLTSNFAIHFFKDQTNSVFQNIVRKGNLELLVKLEDFDSKLIIAKLFEQLRKFKRTEQEGVGINATLQ
jgi:hypothetical protein